MILPVGIGPQEGGYQIERSLRFNSADSAYLSRTLSSSNRQTFTFNVWVKKTVVGSSTGAVLFCSTDNVTSTGWLHFNSGSYGSADTLTFEDQSSGTVLVTSQLFRDPSAWYMITLSVDTTQATASNRVKLYVNGTRVTAFSTETYPAQNANTNFNRPSSFIHTIGSQYTNNRFFNGYLSEVHFIDGSALDPTSFGEYNTDTGVWQPKAYTGSYGTNGFYLDFSDNSGTTSTTLGKDYSGNSNNWTPNNFSVTAGAGNDSVVDVPTNYGTDTGAGGEVRGNYCTWNPLDVGSSNMASSNGSLVFTKSSTGFSPIRGTLAVTSGKYYFEMLANNSNLTQIGVSNGYNIRQSSGDNSLTASGANGAAWDSRGYLYYPSGGGSYGYTFTTNDIVMVAFDADSGKIWFGKNGTWNTGSPSAGTSPAYTASGYDFLTPFGNGESGGSGTANFGQRPFAYSAPSGFKSLCTTNLPDPAIADGSTAFNTVTYAGDSTNGRVIQNGFRPDLVWVKNRNSAFDNILGDTLRLTSGEPTLLSSNLTNAEFANGYIGNISQWTNSSFSVNGDSRTNASGSNYIAWTWLGGNTSGSGVSNTAGSITSTVSANTTAGFSIITYTGNGTSGATIGHGLSSAPAFFVVKGRSFASNWLAQHISVGNGSAMTLNSTAAASASSTYWNNTSPSSTVITLGNGSETNPSGSTMVCYAFAPISGYSAFGSYTGNGSTDGPFVFCGFRPRWIMVKSSSAAVSGWVIYDTVRSTYNVVTQRLFANSFAAQDTGLQFDILSNGFKVREAGGQGNDSGVTYIYAAFAENPFKYSLAR